MHRADGGFGVDARHRRLTAAGVLLAAGCARGGPPGGAAAPAACEARVGAVAGDDASAPPLEAPPSRVVAEVVADTKMLARRIERAIPPRAEGRRVPVGSFGLLSFRVDRGPLAVSVHDGALRVDTHLAAHADLCKPLGGLGCLPYAACDPAAFGRATVPLLLGPAWRPPPARVTVQLTRPCRLTALEIDVSDRIQREAAPHAERLARQIDAALGAVGTAARAAWTAAGVPLPLGLRSCLRVRWSGFEQGTVEAGESERAVAAAGVTGEARVESSCGDGGSAARSLPEPRHVPGLQPEIDLRVPAVVSWDEATADAARTVAPAEVRAGEHLVRLTTIALSGGSAGVSVAAGFVGRACGTARLSAQPAFDPASGRLVLANARPTPDDAARARATLAGLDIAPLGRVVEERARIALPIDVGAVARQIEDAVARLAGAQDDVRVDLRLRPATVERIVVAREGLAAVVRIRGALRLEANDPAGRAGAQLPQTK